MDLSKVRAIVEKHIEKMRWDLQLQDWQIDTVYASKPHGNPAEVNYLPEYRRATMTFDPSQLETREDVLRALRHELLHLVLAPVIQYHQAVWKAIPEKAEGLTAELWRQANELTVGNLERMLDFGMKYQPWKKRGK